MKDVIQYLEPYGYIDMEALLNKERFSYIFITGARGCGKTYGAIDWLLHVKREPFLLMKRTQVQADFAGTPLTTPISVNLREGQEIVERNTKVKNLHLMEVLQDGEPYGKVYVTALSSISSMRGINLAEVGTVLFDEFIKEPHERPIRFEYDCFRNAMETLGRNREFYGKPPLKVIALSNAIDLANPYYRGFGCVNQVYAMKGDRWEDPAQSLAIYRPRSEAFVARKKKTALYQTGASSGQVLGNSWETVGQEDIRSLNLKYCSPICSIDDVGFYKVQGGIFASASKNPGVPAFDLTASVDRALAHRKYQNVFDALFLKKITYESVDVKLRCMEIAERS